MAGSRPGSPQKARAVPPPAEDSVQGGVSRLLWGDSWCQVMATRAATVLQARRVRTTIGLTLVVVCFLFLGYGIYANWRQLPQYDWRIDYRFLGLSSLLYLLSFGFLVVGWNSIMRRVGGLSSFKENTEIYCYSNILRRVPPSLWFVAGRVYLYREQGVPGTISSVGTFLEMVLILVSGALVYLLFRAVAGIRVTGLTYVLAAIPPVGIALIYLVCSKGRELWSKKAGREIDHTTPFLDSIDIGRWLALYAVAWLAGGIVLHTFVLSVYPASEIRIADSIGIWAASGVIGALAFFVPAGLGLREATLSLLLSYYIPLPVAIVVSVLFRIFTMTGETLCSTVLALILRFGFRESSAGR